MGGGVGWVEKFLFEVKRMEREGQWLAGWVDGWRGRWQRRTYPEEGRLGGEVFSVEVVGTDGPVHARRSEKTIR